MAGIPDGTEGVHETHRGPSRVGTSTLVSDDLTDQKRRAGTTPSSARKSVGWDGGCDQRSGGKVRVPFPATMAATSLAGGEQVKRESVGGGERRVSASRRHLGHFDSQLLLTFIHHPTNCIGSLTKKA